MRPQADARRLMQSRLLRAEPYAGVDPPEVLARQAGIAEEQVIKLDGNENLYGPSPKVYEALGSYRSYHIYPDPQQRRVRNALSDYAGTRADRVVAGVGSDEIIDLLLRLFVGPGERVLQCVPTFGMYATFTQLVGGELVSVPRDEAFNVDLSALEGAVDKDTKVVFITSPNNPTGNIVDESVVRRLLEFDVLVIVDEAYYEFSQTTVAHLVSEYSNLVVLRTFSKWAGLAGLRIGYGIMDPLVAERLIVIKPPYNITTASQVALLASLEDRDLLLTRVQNIVRERDFLYNGLANIPRLRPLPSQANFILCQLPAGTGRNVYEQLAQRGIFVRYYDTSLLRDCIRTSVGLRYHNEALIEALGEIAGQELSK